MFADLVKKNRSYRRFDQSYKIDETLLRELIDTARFTPSSRNAQALKFFIASQPEVNSRIFKQLKWAAYLKEWDGPAEGEQPTAYIIILGDTKILPKFDTDAGITAQTILLAAVEKELGGCMIASINRNELRKELQIEERFEIVLCIAIGKPTETVVIETMDNADSFEYWRDSRSVHHVPKRKLTELIVN